MPVTDSLMYSVKSLSYFFTFIILICGTHSQEDPPISHDPNDTKFYLFPPHGDAEVIDFRDAASLSRSSFTPNAVTVLIVPGFDRVFNPQTTLALIHAYLSTGIKGNFIAVEWKKLSGEVISHRPSGPQSAPRYYKQMQSVYIVGERVADFVCWLVGENAILLNQVHLIGSSIGAQIMGEAALKIRHISNGVRVGRITGLDPANVIYETPFVFPHVPARGMADFVDLYHSNVGFKGTTIVNEADVNIFINNGVFQPGCKNRDNYKHNLCSDRFAIRVYEASFHERLIACECDKWDRIQGRCYSPCVHPTVVGPFIPSTARGQFELKTNADP